MTYFVLTPDGNRFGPADMATLNRWREEGRILPETMIEVVGTGQKILASQVVGLQFETPYATPPTMSFPPPGSSNQPQQFASYQRGPAYTGDIGSSELTLAWVFSSIGFVFCFAGGACSICSLVGIVFPILGLVHANKAAAKGNPNASGPRIMSIISLVLQILALLFFFGIIGLGIMSS